jgi:ABC-2 type transport system ATP-binding protein
MSVSEIVVDIKELNKKFGDIHAVKNVSFSIKKGEIFGLLGPNGSGKSTTIRMLCGVITPNSGKGTLFGYDLKKDIITESKRLIQLAEITGKENALAKTLSGGQKQRLALSCALIHKPKLLVLDEPTAGVDPVSRRQFWKTIVELSAQGVTVFITTHYMDEAEVCDRIGFIYRGDIIDIDTPEAFYEKSGFDNLEDIFISHELSNQQKTQLMSYKEMKSTLRDPKGKE